MLIFTGEEDLSLTKPYPKLHRRILIASEVIFPQRGVSREPQISDVFVKRRGLCVSFTNLIHVNSFLLYAQ